MTEKIKSIPWLPYLAIDFLDSILSSKMSVFEWGSGGSTLYFSTRVASIISVEHNEEWLDKVPSSLNVQLTSAQQGALGDDKANPTHYLSGSIGDKNFKEYASAIDKYNNFDLILVDGRSRPSCLLHANQKIKPGGWIVLDNVERDYYLEQTSHLFEDWENVKFFGHGPYIEWPWKTIFFRRPFK